MRIFLSIATLLCVIGFGAPALLAEEEAKAKSFVDAFRKGDVSGSLRYRFEQVDDDARAVRDNTGQASTLRTAIKFSTARWGAVKGIVEFEDVTDIGFELDHNNKGAGSLANGVGDHPVIADPDGTEINQALLHFQLSDKTALAVGRQEILLGNVRFVGNVGWRQNHQSYDAVRLTSELGRGVKLNYAYLGDVNRIFGDHKPMDSHLLNVAFGAGGGVKAELYAYVVDYERMADSGLSTTTYGARVHGARGPKDGLQFRYDVELAQQSDGGDNPNEVDAGYWRVAVGLAKSHYSIQVGQETLEGSASDGRFTTPLATLHAWNGWADKFLGTPAGGLVDTFLGFTYKRGPWTLKAVYHDFEADTVLSADSYGSETDLLLSYKAPWKQTFGLKAALYSADDHAADTTKIWAFTAFGF